MEVQIVSSLRDVSADEWESLRDPHFPFSRHDHLLTLETTHCLGKRTGWFPAYILLKDDLGKLCGATWLYEKTNSYGEFVFDHEWAELHERLGAAYFPKGVSSIPFTPATGQKLLCAPGPQHDQIQLQLIHQLKNTARRFHLSSQHNLFISPQSNEFHASQGFHLRTGVQFHWRNENYKCFEDFLSALKKKKRKEIRYERKNLDSDLELKTLTGAELTPEWAEFAYTLYRKTNAEKMSFVCLTPGYFQEVFEKMSECVTFFVAIRKNTGKAIAGALYFHEGDCMYGRYWGCFEDRRFLHFELCYYLPIEHAISRGTQILEAGAQGSHKISRGFLPSFTTSAHCFFQSQIHRAFGEFCAEERQAIIDGLRQYEEHLPFKENNPLLEAGLDDPHSGSC